MMSGLNVNLYALGKRLLTILAVLWGAATLTFIAVKLIPGDPVAILSGGDNVVDEAYRAVLIKQFGLDQPLWVQYLRYCWQALQGDFGVSYLYRLPVGGVISDAMQETLPLAIGGLILALFLAITSALLTAGRYGPLRTAVSWLELTLLSTPVYWIGIVLLSLFSFRLQWFPVTGNDGFMSLVLPVITLGLPIAAILSQVLRDGLEDALSQPFSLTVRTRGVSEIRLRFRHGLRHAALAASTLTGTLLASVLGGSVLTETVFGRAGIGQVTLSAIENRDMPLVLGVVMLSAFLFVVINLLVDALYLLIDPRLRKKASAHE
ncbi:ABC transporter permease protein [Pectobacterium atrosepticum SCRI1043]|uniref:ABC transporter permease protein n=1 Tax=Pectobacterium atrosepticum (strain SCRI 1043 / ATCC BAA-672) TaxID=218491 RepID=Q6DA16_PECAS|nr:ABC transporter permease [Pectobacterium atrosepticum]AIA69450.1 ABC transporter permease [Pectobacterium atrosepticum]ATY89290.1 ABC transporter permease [Pectobacterium atrosepticum]KFX15705.1 ABC transporter permease [Pectobacterium atrosepticum]KFX23882.1 ABC transporter permease [Pectobacterium atrosepticum]KMK79948.1 ABC transporter permease [Pectobacterium atrosepticum ICMP 1526]